MRIWIKICATTCIDDALACVEAGADALGFVFAPSKRRLSPAQAREIAAELPGSVGRVGVFCNEPEEHVAEVAGQLGLTAVQLHGDETPAFVSQLAGLLAGRNVSVIKTVLVNDHFEARFAQVCRDYDCIDSILLDSGGGSGRTFNWQQAEPHLLQNRKRLIVAGGLNSDNVGEAIRRLSPWGVDVVSGVEREPGRKDREKLKAFIAAVRRVEQS